MLLFGNLKNGKAVWKDGKPAEVFWYEGPVQRLYDQRVKHVSNQREICVNILKITW